MSEGLDILTFLEKAETIPVIDVRTPAEYTQGHIPAAHNIPLFSDEERKKVGTTYQYSGQKEAVIMGLEFAGPKMKKLATEATKIAVDKTLLLHCWRGGMRSSSMAWLFETVGLESLILKGGYKSFRRHVLSCLDQDYPFIVIGGLTGSGKTDVLRALDHRGEQVLDLEMLAHHKGSAFGSLGEKAQNTNEQFENDIFWQINKMNSTHIIWVEDESRNIGKNTLPAGVHRSIRSAPLIFLDVSLPARVEHLVRNYAKFPEKDLIEAIEKIRPRLGDQMAREAIEGIKTGHPRRTAELVLHYYDKTYNYGLEQREKDRVFHLPVQDISHVSEIAGQILDFIRANRIKEQRL